LPANEVEHDPITIFPFLVEWEDEIAGNFLMLLFFSVVGSLKALRKLIYFD
jgi:hypothetical protein